MAANDVLMADAVIDASLKVLNGQVPATTITMFLCNATTAVGDAVATTTNFLDVSGTPATFTTGISGIANGAVTGRKLTFDSVDFTIDNTVNAGVTANKIAVGNGTNVIYTQVLSSDVTVANAEVWTMPAFSLTIPEIVA